MHMRTRVGTGANNITTYTLACARVTINAKKKECAGCVHHFEHAREFLS